MVRLDNQRECHLRKVEIGIGRKVELNVGRLGRRSAGRHVRSWVGLHWQQERLLSACGELDVRLEEASGRLDCATGKKTVNRKDQQGCSDKQKRGGAREGYLRNKATEGKAAGLDAFDGVFVACLALILGGRLGVFHEPIEHHLCKSLGRTLHRVGRRRRGACRDKVRLGQVEGRF